MVGCGKQATVVVLTLSLGGYPRYYTFYRIYFKRIRQVAGLSRANRGVSCAFLFETWLRSCSGPVHSVHTSTSSRYT